VSKASIPVLSRAGLYVLDVLQNGGNPTKPGGALMTRSTKYVALDVHRASTVASVREETGRVIALMVLPTDERTLVEFFRGMRGSVHVTFEEGTQAQCCTMSWGA